jgi:creatinine amidohydrolase
VSPADADGGLGLLAARVAEAPEHVARVPDLLDALLERPARLPRCLVTTGIGTSEGHARHLAETAARYLGQPARFATTGALALGPPPGAEHDWLVVFSQGLSANARFAFHDVEAWGGVVLVTGVASPAAGAVDESDEAGIWRRALEARGVVVVELGCGPERGLLLRVIGARVGYAIGWSLLRTLAARRLEPDAALRIAPDVLRDAQVDAADRARRLFVDDAALAAFFAADRPLLLVGSGGRLELVPSLALEIAEGMLRPAPQCIDVLHFAHGPLQSLASDPLSILYLDAAPEAAADDASGRPAYGAAGAAEEWRRRFERTIDPARHTMVVLRARLPLPFAALEYEAMLDELVLRGLAGGRIDLVDWPGAEREGALYAASPALEQKAGPAPAGRRRAAARLEEAVWPEVEAWLAEGRLTALVALGSIEQHGPHLPLGTDRWIAQALADGLAARVGDAVALPPVAVGCASEHLDFPGTLHVEVETLERLLTDGLRSLERHGFERAFLFTAHGGNLEALGAMAPRLSRAAPGLRIHVETRSGVGAMQARAVASEGLDPESAGPHAGEFETSVVAHLRPGSVRIAALHPGLRVSDPDDAGTFYPSLRAKAGTGVVGDPSRASAARGGRYLSVWLDRLEAAYRAAFDQGAALRGGADAEKKRQ